jgi:hypothetical protein
MFTLSLLTVPISDLKSPDWSITKLTKQQGEALEQSILQWGQLQPVIVRELVDGSLELVDGSKVVDILEHHKFTNVSVVTLGRISESEAREIHLAINLDRGRPEVSNLADNLETVASTGDVQERAERELRLLKVLPIPEKGGVSNTVKKLRSQGQKKGKLVDSEPGFIGFKFRVPPDAAKVCDSALTTVEKTADCKRDRAFELLCADALAGNIGG